MTHGREHRLDRVRFRASPGALTRQPDQRGAVSVVGLESPRPHAGEGRVLQLGLRWRQRHRELAEDLRVAWSVSQAGAQASSETGGHGEGIHTRHRTAARGRIPRRTPENRVEATVALAGNHRMNAIGVTSKERRSGVAAS